MDSDFEIETYAFTDPRVGGCYGFLMHHNPTNTTLGLDAGRAEALLNKLEERGWELDELWITHHDFDHTDGLLEVKSATGCVVTGPKNQTVPIDGLDKLVQEGDDLSFAGQQAQIMYMPGHTNDMLNYYFPKLGVCFVGDVIFPMGCGRLKEGTPEQMWASLQKLMQLPHQTQLYSCHEYAESNAAFALTIEPENEELLWRLEQIKQNRAQKLPTVPATLEQELLTNPFLRVSEPAIIKKSGVEDHPSGENVFGVLRKMKDNF